MLFLFIGFVEEEVFFLKILDELGFFLFDDLGFSVLFSLLFSVRVEDEIQEPTYGVFGEIVVDVVHHEVHSALDFVVERRVVSQQVFEELDENSRTKFVKKITSSRT